MAGDSQGARASGSEALSQARKAKRMRRAAKILILLLSPLLGLLYGIAHSPLFRIERVRIRCADRTTALQAARAVKVGPEETTFFVDAGALLGRIVACPRVKDASLERRLPRELIVTVEPRKPVAALVIAGGCLVSDDEGVCITRAPEPPPELPCIRGIPLTGVRPGDRVIGPRIGAALECIGWERRLEALQQVTVDVARLDDIRVWTASGTPGMIGDRRDLGYKMAAFAAAVEFLRDGDRRARYVDVRDPDGLIVWEEEGADSM